MVISVTKRNIIGAMTQNKDTPIRVLLVDDEADLIEYMVKRLSKKGLAVEGVLSGPEAIELASRKTFDVAVIDLKMPEMDGIEVLQTLHQTQLFLQAIMLTGHGSIDSALESGRHNAFRFLVKPQEMDKLMQTIAEAHACRRKMLKEAFMEDLTELNSTMSSPMELVETTNRLRAKYEQG